MLVQFIDLVAMNIQDLKKHPRNGLPKPQNGANHVETAVCINYALEN